MAKTQCDSRNRPLNTYYTKSATSKVSVFIISMGNRIFCVIVFPAWSYLLSCDFDRQYKVNFKKENIYEYEKTKFLLTLT